MGPEPWTATDIPDQRGRTALITGANTGLGFEIARALASRGATVVLACRSMEKADAAAGRIALEAPSATIDTVLLDQSSLAVTRAAAESVRARHPRIDLLINNAGMLGSRERTVTDDGVEATFGTNHLGVFALTGLLLDRVIAAPAGRIVTMSSISNAMSTLDFDDLQAQRGYRRDRQYSRSKLANLMFAYDLHDRLEAAGATAGSLAAHPGQSRTEFTRGLSPVGRFLYGPRARVITRFVMQDKSVGVLPALRAATDPHARSGEYYGPGGPLQLTGHPVRVSSNAASRDRSAQRRLWEESEALTGIVFPIPAGKPAG